MPLTENEMSRIKKILLEDDVQYFTDDDIQFYVDENKIIDAGDSIWRALYFRPLRATKYTTNFNIDSSVSGT